MRSHFVSLWHKSSRVVLEPARDRRWQSKLPAATASSTVGSWLRYRRPTLSAGYATSDGYFPIDFPKQCHAVALAVWTEVDVLLLVEVRKYQNFDCELTNKNLLELYLIFLITYLFASMCVELQNIAVYT